MNAIHARSQLRYWPTAGKNLNSTMLATVDLGRRPSSVLQDGDGVRPEGPVVTAVSSLPWLVLARGFGLLSLVLEATLGWGLWYVIPDGGFTVFGRQTRSR
jgi:hypothetical protein